MQHYVHGSDGEKYGPADLAVLRQWKAEGRLLPDTLLEPEVGGAPFPAKSLPELYPEEQQRQSYGQADWSYVPYPHPSKPVDLGKSQAIAAWILGAVSICVCPVGLGAVAIYMATQAKSKGHPQGNVLIGYTIACLAVGIGLAIAAYAMFKF
ncbi:MAG: hypothetical protein JST30_14835 [Armatimonadetes bacterium]|nr:hypothetical protein [Armatimonadota bacterium]